MSSKCYIILRTDLGMDAGKVAAQVGHGIDHVWYKVLVNTNNALSEQYCTDLESLNRWIDDGRRKIILKIDSEEKLLNLVKKVQDEGFSTDLIYDYGFTHFNGETLTGFVVHPQALDIKSLKRVRLW